ncbi:putative transposase [Mycobacteroides abscessus subsp. bolletii 2B-1231]|jgi:transposase|uniref:Transposase n=5 Tax=Mycobacteriaceae TaxID=1762 RepID=W9B0N0_MYCCO|nr:putative transposase [Mycobacteroides abscessus subsp. bolletii 2B-0912-R]EIV22879.1 putative transposase [Mycobacteroides abscessus subsp. bolletii 2B-0912-S]EIV76823.1 putative transposase [Mycobacteroides abscessus subsp. bolletii 2B-1231]EIV79981.1 putative transposase [Mycobacteroides abscessus subsp. bolletii 2B-0107]ESV59887.1 iS21 family transposase [Mycobacteroides abscessus MAB_082312_2258]CDO08697.1 transposase [Mycolicibacterium cosmeticum]CPZ79471.1 transposase [Mycobacteroide
MPELSTACQAFRGTVAAKVVICKPGDPEAKGLVERFHDYLERAFLPGRVFTSPTDFNAQLGEWLVIANHRQHRVLGCRPADRIEADKAAMLPLSPVEPTTGWRTHARLPRDHYVRLDANDYSVHPAAVGRHIEVVADLARVRVWCAGRLVADHDRIWAKHQTISDPAHLAAAKAMRRNRFDVVTLPTQVEVQQRPLTDYDALIDIDGPVA